MLKNFTIAVLSLCLILISEVSGPADKKVILATHESPPYSGSRLKNKGILSEIVTAAFYKEGYRTEIKVVPWKRGFEKTKDGVYDGLFGCWHRKEREQWFIYSEPLIANELVFLKKSGTVISLDGDYSSLKNYRIGYIRGYAYPPIFESVKDSLKIEMVTKNIHNLKKLEIGRLDLIMIDRLLSRYILRTEMPASEEAFEEIDLILARDPNHLVFSKESLDARAKAAAFARGLNYLKKEGIIEKILKRHGL
jgi:polar amino acid transport system substrate-binding protein